MAENITVGEGGRKSKAPRWPFVVGLVLALIAMAALGGLIRYEQTRHNAAKVNLSPQLPSSVQDAQALLNNGDPDGASASIDKSLQNKTLSSDERYELYVEQGRIAFNQNDFKTAATAYKNAYNVKQTFDVARKLGGVYQQLGDKDQAITYYKKAIALNPKDSPSYESDNNVLNQMIQSLESGQ